ncbi:MAG: FkbM family methyltransferase [Xanthobacteraceae bacterium]
MTFWRRQWRSIRKRVVRARYGDRSFVTDYLGAKFLVRLDNVIGREIAFRSFERDRIENFIALCEEGKPDLFLDLGANCGVYTCILLENDYVPRAVLFEPDRENADLLRTNLEINNLLTRVDFHQAAAGTTSGRATLVPGPSENNGQSRIESGVTGYTIDVVATDDVVPAIGKTLAIKIDVEGYECQALAGMARLLRENRGFVQIESYDHEPEVTATMTAAGYSLVTDMRPDFVFAKR